jgi:hypothetical protein
MNDFILISLVIIFIYIFLFFNRHNVIYIKAYTGEKFMVYKDEHNIDNNMNKANLLAQILKNLLTLKKYLVTNINMFPDYKEYIEQLDRNFKENRTVVYETDPASNLTSYSVNKGEELSFCLKSKKNGNLHDINLLMYVAIHEMAHIACPEIGHGNLFKKIFKKFLEVAITINLYRKDDYSVNNVEYCGMMLTSSIV